MTLARKIQESIEKSSWIRKMFEEGLKRKAMYGADNVFDFSLGNPDLPPPSRFREVVEALLDDPRPGLHGYMPNAGFADTREAVAGHLRTFNGEDFTADDIVMTVGAGGALNVVFKALLDPGEEVIIPAPYFMEYNFYLDNHQGKGRIVPTKPDFSLDIQAVEAAITEKTKAVLINSPNNPTGRVYPEEDIVALGRLLKEKGDGLGKVIYLISDEPYRKIVFDGITVPSIFDAYSESFVVTSFSKDLSLPGERIGYVAANPVMKEKGGIMAGLILANRILGFVNAPALFQRAVAGLLEETVDVAVYQARRDMLYDNLTAFGYDIPKPEGTFYLFPRCPIEDDAAFVNALQEENILVVPGSGFMGPGHFRIAFCVEEKTIQNSLPGFERVLKKFQ